MLTDVTVKYMGPGFHASEIANTELNMGSVYSYMIVEWAVLMVLWWYLHQVIPSAFGVSKHPLFFLSALSRNKSSSSRVEPEATELELRLPDDVQAEKDLVSRLEPDNKDYAIIVKNLKKIFPASDGNPAKVAVDGISFG